jgi:tRNA 2-thiouridine synthesizing protein A
MPANPPDPPDLPDPPGRSRAPDPPDAVEDARGLLCPIPVIRLGQRMHRVAPGGVVVLLADDPLAEEDVRLWAKGHGHEVLDVVREGTDTRIRVRRASGS